MLIQLFCRHSVRWGLVHKLKKSCLHTEPTFSRVRPTLVVPVPLMRKLPPVHSYVTNARNNESLDKKLYKLMDNFDIEHSVTVIEESAKEDILPSGTCIVSFMEQLANLGEIKHLLRLQEILLKDDRVSSKSFYTNLSEAFIQSGHIEEAINLLKTLYYKNNSFYQVEIFFTLVTIAVIQNYPDQLNLIEAFVKNCEESKDPGPDYQPLGHLWKCYMLTERYPLADELLSDACVNLRPLVPKMVTAICDVGIEHIEKDKALEKILIMPQLKIKPKLKVLVIERLLMYYCTKKDVVKVCQHLERALKIVPSIHPQNVKYHIEKLLQEKDQPMENTGSPSRLYVIKLDDLERLDVVWSKYS